METSFCAGYSASGVEYTAEDEIAFISGNALVVQGSQRQVRLHNTCSHGQKCSLESPHKHLALAIACLDTFCCSAL